MARRTTAAGRALWLRGAAVSQFGDPRLIVQRFVVTRAAAILNARVVVVEFVVTQPDQPGIHRTRLLISLAVHLRVSIHLRVAVDLLRSGHRIDRLRGRRRPELLTRRGLIPARPVVAGIGIAGIAIAVVIRRTTLRRTTLARLATMTLVAAVTLVTVRVAPVGT
jgi:hypothetical protein